MTGPLLVHPPVPDRQQRQAEAQGRRRAPAREEPGQRLPDVAHLRLNRGGNRRLNAILHRVAIAQARSSPAARAYLARRESEGKTRREAIRALKRFLVRAIWRLWLECARDAPACPASFSPAAA
jgi:hypothetical protein